MVGLFQLFLFDYFFLFNKCLLIYLVNRLFDVSWFTLFIYKFPLYIFLRNHNGNKPL